MEISESNRQINVFVPHEHVGYDLSQEPVIRWKDESKEGEIIRALPNFLDSGFQNFLICDSVSLRQIWGSQMGKPHPLELRERVVAFVEEGNTHRATAAHFRVSIKFVNDMANLKRETGSLAPKRQGNGGWSKLGPYEDWVRARLVGKSDLTQEALARELHEEHGLRVAVSTIGYWLHRLGLTHKKRPARS